MTSRLFTCNGEDLPVGIPFTIGETQYPANWLLLATAEELAELEIEERFAEEPPVPGPTAEQIAASDRLEKNQRALVYLMETDWMVTRFIETGEPVPEEIKIKRQAARDSIVRTE